MRCAHLKVILVLALSLPSCAIDLGSSSRPRSINLYGQSGQSRAYGQDQRDWSLGANVRFDMYYKDEYETDKPVELDRDHPHPDPHWVSGGSGD